MQEKPLKMRSAAWQSVIAYFLSFPVERRFAGIKLAARVLLIAILISFKDQLTLLYLQSMSATNGLTLFLPVTYLSIRYWKKLSALMDRIRKNVMDESQWEIEPVQDNEELAEHIFSDKTCTIKCLQENFDLPFQKANKILKALSDSGAMTKDKNKGMSRVLSEDVTIEALQSLLNDPARMRGELRINTHLEKEINPFIVHPIS